MHNTNDLSYGANAAPHELRSPRAARSPAKSLRARLCRVVATANEWLAHFRRNTTEPSRPQSGASRTATRRLLAFCIGLPLLADAFATGVPYLYASQTSTTNLKVFQGSSLKRTITVGSNPTLLAASPDGSRVYVVNSGSASVSVVNTLSNTVVATIPVETTPYGVAMSPNGLQVYVSNRGTGRVSVIDTASNFVVSTIPVSANPAGVVFSPDGNTAYVGSFNGTVSVINVASRTVTAVIGGFQIPHRVAISPSGGTLYVSDLNQHAVKFVDTATNTVTSTVTLTSPRAMVVLPDGRLYAAMDSAASNSILTAINPVTAIATSINMAITQYGEITYYDGKILTTGDVKLSQLDTSSNIHTANIPIGILTSGIMLGDYGNTVAGVVGGGSGSITGSASVAGGDVANMTVTPAAGNQIASVTADVCAGSLSGNTYTTGAVTTRLCTVTATFTPIPSFSCIANSSPGDSTVINCTGVSASGTLTVPNASCGAVVSGNVTCSGATSATGTAPNVTLAMNGGALTVAATPTFTVVGTVGSGSGSITPTQTVASGVAAVLAVVPQTGYHVGTIATSGCDGAFAAPNYTTSPITAACTVTVNFAIDTFAVATAVNPVAGGTLTCAPNPVPYGGNSTCNATANTGYTFNAFGGDCAGASCVLSNVTMAKSVTASFTLNSYAITTAASPPAGGSVSCSPNPVPHGSTSTCTATANAGYTFGTFSGDCSGATCSLSNVTGPRSVTASFALNAYTITTAASPPAGGTVSCSPNPVSHGGDSTCTATANTGYTFNAFGGDCAGASCVLSNVTTAKSVTASFTLNSYAITTAASPPAGGSVSCSPNPVPHGSTSTCTATANAGYTFGTFSGDCSGATCSLSNVTGPRSVTASFTLNTYTITTAASPPAGGTVSCSPNPVSHGGDSTCTATANAGFTFGSFSGDCTGSSCLLTAVTASKSVTASFVATTTFAGPTATGTGMASATITGGGAACHFDAAATGFVLPTVPASTSRIAFPHGWFTFKAVGCTTGSTLHVTIDWPDMTALSYVKYRASAAAQPGMGFFLPANLRINGNTVSFDVTDGGSGDDDLAANGEIRDPGGPAQFLGAEPVPAGGLAPTLALLMLLLAAGAWAQRHSRRPS